MKFASRTPTDREAEAEVKRTVIVFAWRPINCDDGHTYWLRKIVIERQAFFGWYRREPTWKILSKMPLSKVPKARALLKGDRDNG